MAEKNIPIAALPPRPEGCKKVDGGRVVCDTPQIPPNCKLLEDNKVECPDQENCKLVDNVTVCEGTSSIVHVGPPEADLQTVFLGHAYLVVIAAILSLAVTQIIKPFIFKTCNDKSDAVTRLVAVLTGAGIAYTLSKPFMMIDVYMGASAGAINAFVIKMFKAKVKKSLGVDETPEPKGEET